MQVNKKLISVEKKVCSKCAAILLCCSDVKMNHCLNSGYLLKTNIRFSVSVQSTYWWYFQELMRENSFSSSSKPDRDRLDANAELRLSETSLQPWASEGGFPMGFEIISKKGCFFNFEG